MTSRRRCVTDRNPDFDPADIRGAASSDPDGGRRDEERPPGNYPAHDGDDTSTCATCWRDIPTGELECPFCANEDIGESSVPESMQEATVEPWSFGRVVIAVVEANSDYHARALGAAAFSVASEDDLARDFDVPYAEVMPRAEFNSEPSNTLTEGWPDLPPEAPVDQPEGRAILETAVQATDWGAPDTEPVIYREDGTPLTNSTAYEALSAAMDLAEDDYWVVPGFVKRYEIDPEGDAVTRMVSESSVEYEYYCRTCADMRTHTHIETDGFADHPYMDRPIWVCNSCCQPRHEPTESRSDSGEDTPDHFPDGLTKDDVHGNDPTPEDLADKEFEDQMAAHRERHGVYPWE